MKRSLHTEMNKVRILDCCSGTQSIERWVETHKLSDRVEVISVDIATVLGKLPTHLADITTWDYKAAYPVGHFDIVWASPPCTQYSVARSTGPPRDLVGADKIVQRCLDIIDHFKPKVWVVENPAWGLLRGRPVVQGLPSVICSYCQYGMTYRKDTRFWTNLAYDEPEKRNGFPKLQVKRCDPKTCPAMINGIRHKHRLSGEYSQKPTGATKWTIGKVPTPLLNDMLGGIVQTLYPDPSPVLTQGGVLDFL
jgi:hypothetical protein